MVGRKPERAANLALSGLEARAGFGPRVRYRSAFHLFAVLLSVGQALRKKCRRQNHKRLKPIRLRPNQAFRPCTVAFLATCKTDPSAAGPHPQRLLEPRRAFGCS
jgi:hypothetical protein